MCISLSTECNVLRYVIRWHLDDWGDWLLPHWASRDPIGNGREPTIVLNCTQCKPKIVLRVLFILHIVLKLCKPPDVLHALSLQERPIGAHLHCKSCRVSKHYFENCSTCKNTLQPFNEDLNQGCTPHPAPPGPQEKMLPGPPQPRKFSRLPRPAPPHPTLKMPRVELLLRPALRILLPARPTLKIFLLPRPDPKQKNAAPCIPDLKKSASSVPAMALLISKSNQLVLFQLYALIYQLDDM